MAPVLRVLATQRKTRRSQLELLKPSPGGVVFLGDSITELCNWDEWFPDLRTLNRGIASDTVGGVLDRLDSTINAPHVISLLIGTNDLGGLGPSRDVDAIAEQCGELVSRIRNAAPGAVLLVNSVMPRKPKDAARVRALNASLRRFAEEAESSYVDLWPALADDRGGLRADYTNDNLHLTGLGYRAWVETLRPYLEDAARRTTKETHS